MKILAALATVLALVLPTYAQAIDNSNFGGNEPCSYCSELSNMFAGNDPVNTFPTPPAGPGYTPPSGFGLFSQNPTYPTNPFDFTGTCSYCGTTFDFTNYCSYCEMYCPLCSGGTQPVPEAENYALMLAGLAFVGYAAQRRRKLS